MLVLMWLISYWPLNVSIDEAELLLASNVSIDEAELLLASNVSIVEAELLLALM